MARKHATIHDIAKKAGVSSSTVSRALQDNPLINSKTRERIKALAAKLNYQPNVLAHNLRKGNSKMVGVLVPRIDHHFFSSVIGGIEKVLNDAGYNVLILQALDSSEKEIMNVQSLLEQRIAGVLASPLAVSSDSKHYELLVKNEIPLIFFDNAHIHMPVSMVLNDDYRGARLATEHLIAQGCRKIMFLGGPRDSYIYKRRLDGYKDAMQDNRLLLDEKYIFSKRTDFIHGKEVAELILKEKDMPDGAVSVTDHQAIHLIQALKKEGIKIPFQIAITGFSNADFSSIIEPSLTTIDQHSREMGTVAANMLLEEMELRKTNQFIPKKIFLTPELIIRQSSLRSQEGSVK
jgi:LacI family transcriptional regulator